MKESYGLPTYFFWNGMYWKSISDRVYHGYSSLFDYQLNTNVQRVVNKSKLHEEVTSDKKPYVIQLPENFKYICIKTY